MRMQNVEKIDLAFAPIGAEGQRILANGQSLAMRLWQNERPGPAKSTTRRPYETVGYCIAGKAELIIEGRTVLLQSGTSWTVPREAEHSYRIIDEFTAVEATSPPASRRVDATLDDQAVGAPTGEGQLVAALFETRGIAEDAINRLKTEGYDERAIGLRMLKDTAAPATTSAIQPELDALDADPMIWGDVHRTFARFLKNGETLLWIRTGDAAAASFAADTLRKYSPLDVAIFRPNEA